MTKKTSEPAKTTEKESQQRTMYVNAPDQVLSEIDLLIETRSLARAKFLGVLLELGLDAYKKGPVS